MAAARVGTGLTITGGASTVRGLIINRFSSNGISLSGRGRQRHRRQHHRHQPRGRRGHWQRHGRQRPRAEHDHRRRHGSVPQRHFRQHVERCVHWRADHRRRAGINRGRVDRRQQLHRDQSSWHSGGGEPCQRRRGQPAGAECDRWRSRRGQRHLRQWRAGHQRLRHSSACGHDRGSPHDRSDRHVGARRAGESDRHQRGRHGSHPEQRRCEPQCGQRAGGRHFGWAGKRHCWKWRNRLELDLPNRGRRVVRCWSRSRPT